jgi:hypothetical protein
MQEHTDAIYNIYFNEWRTFNDLFGIARSRDGARRDLCEKNHL